MRIGRRSFLRGTAWAGLSGVGALGVRWSDSARAASSPTSLRIKIWSEGTAPASVYPQDVHGALADFLGRQKDVAVTPARLGDPDAGVSDAVLDATDVLIWWGRLRHDDVPTGRAEAIVRRVRQGRLGLVALHASYASKPFKALMGTACEPAAWRDDGQPEHVAVQSPDHPIARGVEPFTLARSAMYAEPFSVPTPETVVLVSSWDRGETFRSGLTWTIGKGRVVYLRPGHQAFPDLFHPCVRQVIANAACWAGRRC